MSDSVNTPLGYDNPIVSLLNTNGTVARILVDQYAPRVATAVSGETAIPGESAVRQRVFTGGCRLLDITASSTDTSARSVYVWRGNQIATVCTGSLPSGSPGSVTGAVTITGTNTITRASGSWITDGVKAGDVLMLFAPTAGGSAVAANGSDGVEVQITGVTALALTAAGTVLTNETLVANTRVFRVAQRQTRSIPIQAGNVDGTPSERLLGNSMEGTADVTGAEIGYLGVVIVGMAVALTSGKRMTFEAQVGMR